MIVDLASLNAASTTAALAWFRNNITESSLCDEWGAAIMGQRPFDTRDDLLATAERTWQSLSDQQRVTILNGHPEIGRTEAVSYGEMEAQEQAGMLTASNAVAERINQDKAAYRQRHGFIFMIFATGLSADELADALKQRLDNSRDEELKTATTEFWRIHEKRLRDKL